MKRFMVCALMAVFVISCGGGAGKMDIKIGEKATSFAVKSSGTEKSVKTFTDKDNKVTTATSFYIIMTNFVIDESKGPAMRTPLTAPDQTRVTIQLIGEEGTNKDSELKPGTYKADPAGKFMKVDSLSVATFADGKEVSTSFDMMFSASKVTGEVRVKSVTADMVSGEIDITDGDKSVKGTFTGKIAAKK